LAHESSLVSRLSKSATVSDLFKLAFDLLKQKTHRHEYVYKAALAQKVLLGTHSLQTASMLSEFRVGYCKADVAILNGTSTVYEIKSERDSLSRLKRQIESYKRVFARVYVIAGENHVASVLECVSSDVGVMKLSDRYQISTLREAIDCSQRTSPIAILDAIRLSEAKAILRLMNADVPDVPNTELYGAMRDRFASLDACAVHFAMVRVLKKTRNLMPLADLLAGLPIPLYAAALSVRLRTDDRHRVLRAVKTSIEDALLWK